MNEREHFELLFNKLIKGELSADELDFFLVLSEKYDLDFQELLAKEWDGAGVTELKSKPRKRSAFMRFILSRASIVILGLSFVSAAIYFYTKGGDDPQAESIAYHVDSVQRELAIENGLVETSGVGSKIILSDTTSSIGHNILDHVIKYAGLDTVTVHAGTNKPLKYTMPDGTRIVLNKNAQLKYCSDYGNTTRYVMLEGEAFFDVERNVLRPFVVHTDHGNVRVLGTVFTIDNSVKNKLYVYLKEGAVRYSYKDKVKQLEPNQYLFYDLAQGYLVVTQADDLEAMDWYYDLFYFNRASLRDVLVKIATHYNYRLIDDGATSVGRYSGTISRSESLEEVIKILELTDIVKLDKERRIINIL